MIDGSGDDEVWRAAHALEVTVVGVWGANVGKTAKLAVTSVQTDSHIAFLVSWEDATRDDKAHNFHWNVTGPMFNTLHLMFMEQYSEQWNALDVIAEPTAEIFPA